MSDYPATPIIGYPSDFQTPARQGIFLRICKLLLINSPSFFDPLSIPQVPPPLWQLIILETYCLSNESDWKIQRKLIKIQTLGHRF